MRYAEVIGDPIAQSKSPIIHKYWLDRLKLTGDYRRTLVSSDALAGFLEARRGDPDWLGCNVTIPHKESSAKLVDEVDETAKVIGATNCILPRAGRLWATNTDVDGIAAALDSVELDGRKTVIIGGGGAARAAIFYLAGRRAETLVLVRNPEKAERLRNLDPKIEIAPLTTVSTMIAGAAAIINASPLGMMGCPAMPPELLAAVARQAPGTTLLDLVYNPLETDFLATGRQAGARVVDGLAMLIGQASRAFELFFGARPPPTDERLRDLLVGNHSSASGYKQGSKH
jgi:shikimate dehydrogenase